MGLIGEKKHKNNGLNRIAVVDFKNLSANRGAGSTGIKGAVKIAEQVSHTGNRANEFEDIKDDVAWKLLGVEGEKIVGYMLVARLNPETASTFTKNRGKTNNNEGFDLHHLVEKSQDPEVCQYRASNLKMALDYDFTVEWRNNHHKLGVLAPKLVGFGSGAREVLSKMNRNCKDGGYFVVSNAYFWLKEQSHKSSITQIFNEENGGQNYKVLNVKDKIINVIYDNIDKIELTLDGLKDSFGHTMKWGEKAKPIVNLKIKH